MRVLSLTYSCSFLEFATKKKKTRKGKGFEREPCSAQRYTSMLTVAQNTHPLHAFVMSSQHMLLIHRDVNTFSENMVG